MIARTSSRGRRLLSYPLMTPDTRNSGVRRDLKFYRQLNGRRGGQVESGCGHLDLSGFVLAWIRRRPPLSCGGVGGGVLAAGQGGTARRRGAARWTNLPLPSPLLPPPLPSLPSRGEPPRPERVHGSVVPVRLPPLRIARPARFARRAESSRAESGPCPAEPSRAESRDTCRTVTSEVRRLCSQTCHVV